MKLKIIVKILEICALFLPKVIWKYLIKWVSFEKDVALCLHRVAVDNRRQSDPYPPATIEENKLIQLLDFLENIYKDSKNSFFVTFDDGYLDGVQFTKKFASKYPNGIFILFICPEKIQLQAGFRWDLYEEKQLNASVKLTKYLNENLDIESENNRSELKEIYQNPKFQLASVEDIKIAANQPNVHIGNHSNCHFNFCNLPNGIWQKEISNSFDNINRVFGKTDYFAFPFGTPKTQFLDEQADYIQEKFKVSVWSTEPGFISRENPKLVKRRFAISGDQSLQSLKITFLLYGLKNIAFYKSHI